MALPPSDAVANHSSRVYLPEGEIETPEYGLSISEGYLEISFPKRLTISDPTLILLVLFIVDDDLTQLIDDDEVVLIEDSWDAP
jgi:hypothetical protein